MAFPREDNGRYTPALNGSPAGGYIGTEEEQNQAESPDGRFLPLLPRPFNGCRIRFPDEEFLSQLCLSCGSLTWLQILI
jgi:hypothetical protein